jgi:hypothetical protein
MGGSLAAGGATATGNTVDFGGTSGAGDTGGATDLWATRSTNSAVSSGGATRADGTSVSAGGTGAGGVAGTAGAGGAMGSAGVTGAGGASGTRRSFSSSGSGGTRASGGSNGSSSSGGSGGTRASGGSNGSSSSGGSGGVTNTGGSGGTRASGGSEVSTTPTSLHVFQDSNGWTEVTPSFDTQTIYVSTSGKNSYDGLSPAFTTGIHGPKQTIAAGVSLLRNNMPDELLIKCGDSFNEGLDLGKHSGRSASEPLLVSTYGDSRTRPILGGPISVGGGSHVVVLHLNVVQGTASGIAGASLYGNDILLEDCRFDGGQYQGIGIGGSAQSTNIRARRNVVSQVTGHGFFVEYVDTVVVEENIIYDPFTSGNGAVHGMYIARGSDTGPSSNVTADGNLVFIDQNDAQTGNGIMMRPGGIARGNVIAGPRWTGITMGACSDRGDSPPCVGTNGSAIIDNNLMIDSPNGAGFLYDATHIQPPTEITNNIILRNGSIRVGSDQAVVTGNIVAGEGGFELLSGNGMSWNNNVFLFTSSPSDVCLAWLRCTPSQASGGTCANFSARGNRYYPWSEGNSNMSFSTWKADTGEDGTDTSFSFTNPNVSLGTYNGTLGGAATTRAFFETATNQSKSNYDPRYTASAAIAYIREGLVIASH